MRAALRVYLVDLISKSLLAVVGIALVRLMSPLEYAQYTLALAVIAVMTQIISANLNRVYVVGFQQLFTGQSPATFLLVELLGAALIAFIGGLFAGELWGIYWFVVLAVAALCITEFTKTTCQQQLDFGGSCRLELARTLAFVVPLAILALVTGSGLQAWEVLALQAGGAFVVMARIGRQHLSLREAVDWRGAWAVIRRISTGPYRLLIIYGCLVAVLTQVGVFALRLLGTDVEVGSFGSALRYYGLLSLGLTAVHTVLLPTLQQAADTMEIDRIFAEQRRSLAFFVPLVLLAAWLSQWIIPWVDRGQYPQAVTVFQILSASAIVSFALSPYGALVVRAGDYGYMLIAATTALCLSVLLHIVLVSVWGARGAALATLVSFATLNGALVTRAAQHRRSESAPPLQQAAA